VAANTVIRSERKRGTDTDSDSAWAIVPTRSTGTPESRPRISFRTAVVMACASPLVRTSSHMGREGPCSLNS
jgi:hypothetical protein